MKKFAAQLFMIFFSVLLMSSCSSHEKTLDAAVEPKDVAANNQGEAIKGKLNVYSSMARAVKYNVEPATKNIHKLLQANQAETSKQTPQELMKTLLNFKSGNENRLYDSVRILDFSILYAMTRLSPNPEYAEKNIYTKAAQNLALAAIRAHKDALYAEKKINEIDRTLAREKKVVGGLDNKLTRNGLLSRDDQELKKNTEVYLYKLSQMRELLIAVSQNYRALARATDDASLEGRHFYELEDFDERNKLETFQNAGLTNRSEFKAMADAGRSNSMAEIKSRAISQYPEIETLNINGYNVKDTVYLDSLRQRAAKIADNLLNNVANYEKASGVEEKARFKKQAFDEIGTAILAQIEIDYDIVQMVDGDYTGMSDKLAKLRSEIKKAEQRRNMNVEEKNEIMEKKAEYLRLELTQSQISAERAAALRALYFHAGLSPFNQKLMQAPIDGVEENLKIAFNKDMIEMLAQAESVKPAKKSDVVVWTDGDNWLEELVDNGGPKVEKPIDVPQKPMGEYDPYTGENDDKLKIMQLGSYREKANAELEWNMLKELYPQFSNYTPKIESAKRNGKMLYRLILRSNAGGLRDLCNELRADRVECLLR